jgi:hypothetical protein
MGVKHAEHGLYVQQLPEVSITGNYEAQRQLDFRILENEPLRVIPPNGGGETEGQRRLSLRPTASTTSKP